MRITESGSFSVKASLTEVKHLITDPDFLGRALPDSKGYKVTGENSCTVDMTVGVSHIRGVMPTTLKINPWVSGEPLTIKVNAQGLGSRVDLGLSFELDAEGTGTRLDWTSEATVSGVLASVGSGLLRPLAKRNFDAIVAAIQEAIEGSYSTN